MDMTTAIVSLALISALVYVVRLAIREGGDFEAGGGGGVYHFFVKAKPRRKP